MENWLVELKARCLLVDYMYGDMKENTEGTAILGEG